MSDLQRMRCGGPAPKEISGGMWMAAAPGALPLARRRPGAPPAPQPLSYATAPPSPAAVGGPPPLAAGLDDSYLVDSASSHMLVSKIKPCKFPSLSYIS